MEKTWYGGGNYPIPDVTTVSSQAKGCLWGLKAAIMGQLTYPTVAANGTTPSGAMWTCTGSSDGTNAGLDGTDRWGSTYDATKLVRQVGGTGSISWIVLKSPTAINAQGAVYFYIFYTSNNDYQATFYMSKAAPTGGDASHPPTASDLTPALLSQFSNTTVWSSGGKMHYSVDTNGNWWFATSANGSGVIPFLAGIQSLLELRYSADACPIVFLMEYNPSTSQGASHIVARSLYANIGTPLVRSRSYDNLLAMYGTVIAYDVGSTTDYTVDMAGPFTPDGLTDANPLVCYTFSSSGKKGLKGRIPDARQIGNGANVVNGARFPDTGPVQQAVVGTTLIPFGFVPSL